MTPATSHAALSPLASDPVPRSRVYRAKTPNGLYARFTSPSAFDGYVAEWRAAGYIVTFLDPFRAIVLPFGFPQ